MIVLAAVRCVLLLSPVKFRFFISLILIPPGEQRQEAAVSRVTNRRPMPGVLIP